MGESHLDTERIAAYAERRLQATERSEVEAHLADCEECRREASSIAILLRRDRRRRQLLIAGPAALAAVLALTVYTGSTSGPLTEAARLRPGSDPSGGEGVAIVEALRPGGEVTPDSLRFVWRPAASDALYLFVLTDTTGQTVWEGRTADTTLTLPASIALQPGGRYLWLVDALLRDGGMASTGPREFRMLR